MALIRKFLAIVVAASAVLTLQGPAEARARGRITELGVPLQDVLLNYPGRSVDSKSAGGQLVYNPRDLTLYGTHAGFSVFSLNPLTGRHTVLREGPVHQLAVHRSGDVYFAEGPRLLRYEPQIR